MPKTEQPAEIVREYGPFPGAPHVHGVSFDGRHVWFAAGATLRSFDPATGESRGSLDVASSAGTAFDGRHLYQIANGRIQKVDPKTGAVLSTIPAPGRGRGLRAGLGGGDALGRAAPGSEDLPDRPRERRHPAHDRVEPLRHRSHVGGWRALARHLGGVRRRHPADRS
jgi:hypothetical protein